MELTTAISSKQFFRDTYLHFMTFFSLIALIWRVNKLEEDFKVFYIVELFSRIFFFLASCKELLKSCLMNYSCNSGDRNEKL